MWKQVFLSLIVLFTLVYADENQLITDRIQNYVDTINKGGDTSSFWSDDAQFRNPATGDIVEGKAAIGDYIKEISQGKTLTFKISKIDLQDGNNATVKGVVEINNGDRKARKLDLIKQGDNWVIKTVTDIPFANPPDLYSNLKDLEWMIGNWKDSDPKDDVSITIDTKWDKFKNFIVQTFDSKIYDMDEMEGKQIIGWDAAANKIKSWIFDSDGGYGEGVWSKTDKGWQVNITYSLPDGRKGSAVDFYIQKDPNTYDFSSTSRQVDGQIVPNIDPVTLVKEKP